MSIYFETGYIKKFQVKNSKVSNLYIFRLFFFLTKIFSFNQIKEWRRVISDINVQTYNIFKFLSSNIISYIYANLIQATQANIVKVYLKFDSNNLFLFTKTCILWEYFF